MQQSLNEQFPAKINRENIFGNREFSAENRERYPLEPTYAVAPAPSLVGTPALFIEKLLDNLNLIQRDQGRCMAAIFHSVRDRMAVPTQHFR